MMMKMSMNDEKDDPADDPPPADEKDDPADDLWKRRLIPFMRGAKRSVEEEIEVLFDFLSNSLT